MQVALSRQMANSSRSLKRAIEHNNRYIRTIGLWLLVAMGLGNKTENSIHVLLELLDTQEPCVLVVALDILTRLRTALRFPATTKRLLELALDSRQNVRHRTFTTLRELGRSALRRDFLPGLQELLLHGKWSMRLGALRVIRGVGDIVGTPEVLECATKVLDLGVPPEPPDAVFEQLAWVVYNTGFVAAWRGIMPTLVSLAWHVNLKVRFAVAKALGRLAPDLRQPDVFAVIGKMLHDSDASVREAAYGLPIR